MKKLSSVFIMTMVAALTVGGVFAQSPAPADAPKTDVNVDVNKTDTTPAPAAQTNVDINKTETTNPAPAASVSSNVDVQRTDTVNNPPPASTSSSTTTVWGMDGKTVLIGGALLLGIILIAVAAAGRDRSTTVVR